MATCNSRAANPVDMWEFLRSLWEFLGSDGSYFGADHMPGLSRLLFLFSGAPLLNELGIPPSLQSIRLTSAAYALVAAAGVHRLARGIAGGRAAPVAVAAFLFAPATMLCHLNPTPMPFVFAFGIWLFIAFFEWVRQRSVVALVALTTLGGFSAGFPIIAIPAALLAVPTAVTIFARFRTVPRPALIAALLMLPATAIPLLPNPETVAEARKAYIGTSLRWSTAEDALFGQEHPFDLIDGITGAVHAPRRIGDQIAAALLAPVATRRNSLRLWGDVFLEPIGIVLAILAGMALLTRRHPPGSGALAGMAAASLLGGLGSSYDTPSLTRVYAAVPALAVCAAVGFSALSDAFPRRRIRPELVAALISASGTYLFNFVNPSILADSWVRIVIDATEGNRERTVLLDGANENFGYDLSWLNVGFIASQVPCEPLPTAEFLSWGHSTEEPLWTLAGPNGHLVADVMVWSPALEKSFHLLSIIGRTSVNPRIFKLRDASGLSYAWAASFTPDWTPALPDDRWREVAFEPAEFNVGSVPSIIEQGPYRPGAND